MQSDAYGDTARSLAARKRGGIFVDVGGKRSTPLAPLDFEPRADLAHRGLADGLVVSGRATGAATPIEDLERGPVPEVRTRLVAS